jgi:peroxiredoxin
MGHRGYPWYEPLTIAAGIVLYITANTLAPIGWPGWVFPLVPLMLGIFNTVGFLMDLKDFRRTASVDYEVAPGRRVPDFVLPDENGAEVKASDFTGKRNLLLLFVRGDWCPSCHIMLRTYEKNREKFMEKDVMLLAIGPDPVGVNRNMVEKLGLDFRILSDEKQEVVRRFGVQLQESASYAKYETGIPMPASFLVDKSGVVRYTSRADQAGDFLNPARIFDAVHSLN